MLDTINQIKSVTNVIFSRLPYIVFSVTSKCNLKCKHCFYWKNIEYSNKANELSYDEIKKISKKLGKIYYLTLTGGEPTLRNDITDIIKVFYKQNDVKFLSFNSNGFLPEKLYAISKEIIENCPKMMFIVSLSIDGLEKKHDLIRSVKGSFKKMLKSVELLKKLKKFPNFDLLLNTTVMNLNKKELSDIHEFVVNELKVYHDISYIRGDVRDKKTKGDIFETFKLTTKKIEKNRLMRKHSSIISVVKESLIQTTKDVIIQNVQKEKNLLPCQALRKSIVIDEFGKIFPCEMLGIYAGDLRNNSYDTNKILNSYKAKTIIDNIKRKKCFCTWECIIPLNILFSAKGNSMLIRKLAKYCIYHKAHKNKS